MQPRGFYSLYSIDVRRPDNRGPCRGWEVSLVPRANLAGVPDARGAICAHFGWTWHYLHEGIAWPMVQRMMIDQPDYDYSDSRPGDPDGDITLTGDNVDEVSRRIIAMG